MVSHDYEIEGPCEAKSCIGICKDCVVKNSATIDMDTNIGIKFVAPENRKERGAILKEAYSIINKERQDQYGNPEDSFSTIAKYWMLYLDKVVSNYNPEWTGPYLSPRDVAMLMVLLKIARESHQHKQDNLTDLIGYAALADDMA